MILKVLPEVVQAITDGFSQLPSGGRAARTRQSNNVRTFLNEATCVAFLFDICQQSPGFAGAKKRSAQVIKKANGGRG